MKLKSSVNVISFKRDAAFFSKKANQSWDKFNYEKALRYFKRAVEYDESNAVTHCNLAGVLTDMGNYEESNQVLWHVVEKVDPSRTECFYFMANNYAYLQKYEQSEAAITYYLEHDQQGQYMDESEELIKFLQNELEQSASFQHSKNKESFNEHEKARELLEQGKFNDAIKVLERIVTKKPDFLAASNNLAIAYYYIGKVQSAIAVLNQVIERDAGNIHALCNKAIFLSYLGQHEASEQHLQQLSKMVPFSQENLLKQATTMGILQQHERAYVLFRRMIREIGPQIDPCIYHYAAVSACHLGLISAAKWHWMQIKKQEPSSQTAAFYLTILLHAEHEKLVRLVHYPYHLPHEDIFQTTPTGKKVVYEHYKKDSLIRISLLWTLLNGTVDDKVKVLFAYYSIADHDTIEILKAFLLRAEEEDYIKQIALFVLRRIGYQKQVQVAIDKQIIELDARPYSPALTTWKTEWQKVLDVSVSVMEKRYDMIEQVDVEILWIDYLSKTQSTFSHKSKPEGWAGALEHVIAHMHGKPVSYAELAKHYEVSAATLQRNVAMINQVCHIQQKIQTIFMKT